MKIDTLSISTILIILHFSIGLICATHALLTKRDSRSALGWMAVCLGYPFIGSLLYYMFGINQHKYSRARSIHHEPLFRPTLPPKVKLENTLPQHKVIPAHFHGVFNISNSLCSLSLEDGNNAELLQNGDNAYPAMLQAINEAKSTIYLSTYIFQTDKTGKEFIRALIAAKARRVEVYVLIDGIGEKYSWQEPSKLLKKGKVRVARFDPPSVIPPSLYINLRLHRKILVVDNIIAFTGGMNISHNNLNKIKQRDLVQDIHFRLTGPIVTQLACIFIDDWRTATKQHLQHIVDKNEVKKSHSLSCRAIDDGPNEYVGKLAMIITSAISSALKRVDIITPYFLPTQEIIGALQAAALRGVQVNILLPAKNNLKLLHWATRHILPRLLDYGIKIYYQPAPFVHTKLLIIDSYYGQFGSANLDIRSLRLNFEMNIEFYNNAFGEQLTEYFDHCKEKSQEITVVKLKHRRMIIKIRDALFWLFTPYL